MVNSSRCYPRKEPCQFYLPNRPPVTGRYDYILYIYSIYYISYTLYTLKFPYEWPDYMTQCQSQKKQIFPATWFSRMSAPAGLSGSSSRGRPSPRLPRSSVLILLMSLCLAEAGGAPALGILAFPREVNLSRGPSETLCEVTGGRLLPGISSCISNKAVMRLNFCCRPVRFALADVEMFGSA